MDPSAKFTSKIYKIQKIYSYFSFFEYIYNTKKYIRNAHFVDFLPNFAAFSIGPEMDFYQWTEGGNCSDGKLRTPAFEWYQNFANLIRINATSQQTCQMSGSNILSEIANIFKNVNTYFLQFFSFHYLQFSIGV